MATPEPGAIVRGYFDAFGPTNDEMVAAVQDYCDPDIWWSSAGFWEPRFRGMDAFIAELRRPKVTGRVVGMKVETVSLAVAGDKVLTERIDHLVDADLRVVSEVPVMGVACVRDGKILWGRDYFFDTQQFFDEWGS